MIRKSLGLLFPLLLAAGCASRLLPSANSWTGPSASVPANALVTERAILNARRRQTPLNGALALSETGGRRLVITGDFGNVLADVLVKNDGRVFVMQSSPLFRAAWIKHYVASDLECLFGPAPALPCPVRQIETNHFLLDRGTYTLDLRIVGVRPGPQPESLFQE